MAKYITDGTDLTNIANAIRTKGETSAALSFPDGFVSAINAIDTGGGGGGGGEAPDGYTRMKYLESSGTQCIDTGKYAKLTSKIKADGNLLPTSQGAYVSLWGSRDPYCIAFTTNDPKPASITAYTSYGNVSDKSTSAPVWVRGIYETDASTAKATYPDYNNANVSYSVNATSLTENQSSHICLFAWGNNGSYERYAKCRIYEYWYYESDTLIQHMIPVKRNSDNVLGMYDLENDVFYTNAGTGTFTGVVWES